MDADAAGIRPAANGLLDSDSDDDADLGDLQDDYGDYLLDNESDSDGTASDDGSDGGLWSRLFCQAPAQWCVVSSRRSSRGAFRQFRIKQLLS